MSSKRRRGTQSLQRYIRQSTIATLFLSSDSGARVFRDRYACDRRFSSIILSFPLSLMIRRLLQIRANEGR